MNKTEENEKISAEKLDKIDNKEVIKYLMENEVRFAIISALNLFKKPLNLSKLSKITAYPITTIIHHIPNLLDKNLIVKSKVPGERGKFYYLSMYGQEIIDISDSEPIPESFFDRIEETKNMSVMEYNNYLKKFYTDLIESGELTEDAPDIMVSMATFNKNIANFTANFVKKMIKKLQNNSTDNLNIPLSYASNFFSSIKFSDINQLKAFQKLYLTFFNNLIELQNEFDEENKQNNKKIVETAFFYAFTAPIININNFNLDEE